MCFKFMEKWKKGIPLITYVVTTWMSFSMIGHSLGEGQHFDGVDHQDGMTMTHVPHIDAF